MNSNATPNEGHTLPPEEVRARCLWALSEAGYAPQQTALRIVNLEFEFDAVLVGPGDHQELVVVVEQEDFDADAVRRHVSRLALALSRTLSRRPLTLVLIASPSPADLEPLRPFARLVVVPREARDEAEILDALQEFRPLAFDRLAAPRHNPSKALGQALGGIVEKPDVSRLLQTAEGGPEAVESAFKELLQEVLEGASRRPDGTAL